MGTSSASKPRGFVRREIDAEDLRRHKLLLTPAGRKAMTQRHRPAQLSQHACMVAGWVSSGFPSTPYTPTTVSCARTSSSNSACGSARTSCERASAGFPKSFNESPDAIVVFDESARLLTANPAAERIPGPPIQALIGLHFTHDDLLAPHERARAEQLFQAVLDGATRSAEELQIVRPNGQVAVLELTLRLGRSHVQPRI
jgi:PAS domain S-box-containing protein